MDFFAEMREEIEKKAQRKKERDAGYEKDRHHRDRSDRDQDKPKAILINSFAGADCEGESVSDGVYQPISMFCMGDRLLINPDRTPLTTIQMIDFILEGSRDLIYVAFSFNYDVTHILNDMPVEYKKKLYERRAGNDQSVFWLDYGIEYFPGHYFSVKRIDTDNKAIPDTQIKIFETFGFFQSSFVTVLKNSGVATAEEFEKVERNKEQRGSFDAYSEEVQSYCVLECSLLARVMEAFRVNCVNAGIVPRTWNGAGKLATALHRMLGSLTAEQIDALNIPEGMHFMGEAGYFGGRFEAFKPGDIRGPIYENDLCSAYPAAMRELPCLLHGRWKPLKKASDFASLSADDLFIARIKYDHPDDTYLCGVPFRDHTSHSLRWQLRGIGTYWSPEIRSAELLGMTWKGYSGYVYVKDPACTCDVYNGERGIEHYFKERKKLEMQYAINGKPNKEAGKPLKLAVNANYGKLAQRKGYAPFKNTIYAGLITAITRARINEVCARDPKSIIMIATDAVYTTNPNLIRPEEQGDGLGQWEEKVWGGMFVMQPGLYHLEPLDPNDPAEKDKFKSRGYAERVIRAAFPEIMDKFNKWIEEENSGDKVNHFKNMPPTITVNTKMHMGMKLALAHGKPEKAGCWYDMPKRLTIDPTNKRNVMGVEGRTIRTTPHLPPVAYLPGTRKAPGPYPESMSYSEMKPEDFEQMDTFIETQEDQQEHDSVEIRVVSEEEFEKTKQDNKWLSP